MANALTASKSAITLSISAPPRVRSIRSTVFNGRIDIEKINEPFLYKLRGAPAEFKAGLGAPIANGWLALLLKFTEAGAALFA